MGMDPGGFEPRNRLGREKRDPLKISLSEKSSVDERALERLGPKFFSC